MRIKKWLCLALVICLSVYLCGCDMFAVNTDELVSPPALTGDMYPIGQALDKSAASNYTLRYPTAGDRRSAVVLEDIDSDGSFEAFAFYSTTDDENIVMHINVICQRNGGWVSAADQSISALGVERIDFCDLDGDGIKEILVGWQVFGSSDKLLSVYSFTENTFTQRFLQEYTGFICCDLDNNGESEIFIHVLDTTEGINKAALYSFKQEGTHQIAGCIMDSNVRTASEPILSTLSSGQPAVYIDEIKGIGAITEVLFISKGELVNPLLDTEDTLENTGTLRVASLASEDINLDGVIEIPVASDLPNADGGNETLYYTNWCSFNGERLSVKQITIVNSLDGYYLTVPNRLVGKIAVSKDTTNHRRIVYAYDFEEEAVGQRIFSITAFEAKDFDSSDFDKNNMVEIYRLDSTVFAASINSAQTDYPITIDEIRSMFNIIK